MSLTIMTGLWGPAAAQYGENFLTSFDQFWPAEVKLQVWADRPFPVPREGQRFIGNTDGWTAFMERHRGSDRANGCEVLPHWKAKDKAAGKSWRYDARRFAGQLFIPETASAELTDGWVLCWLDADVVSHKPVPQGFIEGLLGDADVAYLGRGQKHSEIGFWACRLSPAVRAFLWDLAYTYRTDAVFDLKEWHSAFVWDQVRLRHEALGAIKGRDLTPGGSGHVWFQSPLGQYLDHLKGDRKAAGRSKERR